MAIPACNPAPRKAENGDYPPGFEFSQTGLYRETPKQTNKKVGCHVFDLYEWDPVLFMKLGFYTHLCF